jgi:3-isopropylmalate dehydrogenase
MMKKYAPALGNFDDIPGSEMAMTTRVVTIRGADRIIRRAFEYAQEHNYPTVTLVEKPNVLRETSGMMVRVAREISKEYPEIELWETNIDAMVMWLLKNPEDYGVMVMGNLFGDIVSDLSAQLVGGLGFASSGNIGDDLAVFEPTHGSAPKYAGQYKVNPNAMLLTSKMMLDWLGESDKARALEGAIAGVILDGKVRTYDMGGDSSTIDVANAVAERL